MYITPSRYSILERIICIPQTKYLRMPILLLGLNCYLVPSVVIRWVEVAQSNYYGPWGMILHAAHAMQSFVCRRLLKP